MQTSQSFLDVCRQYFDSGMVLPVFVIAVIWLGKKWNKEKKLALLAVSMAALLFLYNDVVYKLTGLVGESSTYYRFFWICPIVFIISVFVIELLQCREEKVRKRLIIALFGANVILSLGSLSKWFNVPENKYQLESDVIEVADALMTLTDGNPTTLVDDGTITTTIREYNGKIKITGLYTDQINQVLYTEKTNYLAKTVRDYLSLNASDYVAIEKEKTATNRLIESTGVKRAAQTEGYYIYHVNHETIDKDWDTVYEIEHKLDISANIEYIPISGIGARHQYIYLPDDGGMKDEEVCHKLVEQINASGAEAVFFNTEDTMLLDELEIPYYFNNKTIQTIENEDVIFCMIDNRTAVSENTIKQLEEIKQQEKPVVLILAIELEEQEQDKIYKAITCENSPVIQILTTRKTESKKSLVKDSFLQYAASTDKNRIFTIIRIEESEEQ